MKKSIFKVLLFTIGLLFSMCCSSYAEVKGYTLTWDANSEPDLAGYKVYISTESGNYETPAAVLGLVTNYQSELNVPDDAESDFYWVVTAFDTSGLESDYSNEVTKHFDTRVAPAPPAHLKWYERIIAWIKRHVFFWS
jgi:hypothetical protein